MPALPGLPRMEPQKPGKWEGQRPRRPGPPRPAPLPPLSRPPAPGHQAGSWAEADGRGGRSEGGRRRRREPGWEGGGGVGREKKKENIFRVPACRVSVRFGRKCVGYFGAVTWAGGLREAPGQSQPRACAPPRKSPPLRRASDSETLQPHDRRTPGPRSSLASLLPPFPPGESGGGAGSPARMPGSSTVVGWGRGR